MLCYFWVLTPVRGRIPLSLALLISLPLACLGGLTLYEGVHQPLGQVELVENPGQPVTQSNIMDTLQSLEHHFKENKGQLTNPAVRYYYSQADFGLAFTDTGVVYRLTRESSAVVTLRFEGANPVQPEGQQMYDHLSHYFQRNDPTQWVTGVRSYARIVYPEIYEGIDLVYYFTAEGLKYDLVVKPGADPSAIRFRYEGIERLTLDADGSLTVHTTAGFLRDQALYLYQDTPAGRQSVVGTFALYDATTFGFQVTEPYSSLCPLIVDPLVWSTLLGGGSNDYGEALAVDSANNVYVTGWTFDAAVTDFPTTPGAYDETHNGGNDTFVCKLSADGSSLLYSTFLGGSSEDYGRALALNSANNVYVTGETFSSNFPTTPGAINETKVGGWDVFVCKLSADGSSLLYSTYLGGAKKDVGHALAVDSANNIYVTGETFDAVTDFPTTPGAYDETHNNEWDVFVCKLSADGSDLLYSTFLGGSGFDAGRGLALDSENNVYVTGQTSDSVTDFPTTSGAYDETHNGGNDTFVCKLSADGSSLLYSTFLGESSEDYGRALALDSANNVYVTGETISINFPTTPGAINETHNGGWDVFVCKLSADGSDLLYSTYLGGAKKDVGYALAVDSANNIYITGWTFDAVTDFPTTPGAYDETHNNEMDVFVCKLSADGSSLLYSTFLGGSSDDYGCALALDSENNVYVTGQTSDSVTDFPTTPGAYDETHNSNVDVFVCKITFIPPTISLISPANESLSLSGATIDLSIIGIEHSISCVLYNWDDETNATLASPYDLVLPSGDGQHVLHVYANDTVGIWAVQTYVFTIDDTQPTIILGSPLNNTVQTSGITIDVDVSDLHLATVLFNWDGGGNQTWSGAYLTNLPTGDGSHILYVYANDTAGNWAMKLFVFTVDDTTPSIILISPVNASTYPSGTIISIQVTDTNTIQVHYNWDGATNVTLNIAIPLLLLAFPTGNGPHVLHLYAQDQAGNWDSKTYIFTTEDAPITTPIMTVTTTVTVTPSTSSTIGPTPTDFLTVEIFLLGLGALAVIIWRRKKQRVG